MEVGVTRRQAYYGNGGARELFGGRVNLRERCPQAFWLG
ncbi:hypothetical protein MPNT_10006 [Candidatus Methylacidithermus pantelleriae]|uniref:Uncharacterized protein n=1 Tax=Candidatus Methylacidithermus pantelleriae TaxID=2744239 RepID=A0A8J2BGX3_9BACT|nr:hypothetical protein MPNT_10006 [Candidatus Methylacidithermus pantelleriae]